LLSRLGAELLVENKPPRPVSVPALLWSMTGPSAAKLLPVLLNTASLQKAVTPGKP